MYGNDFGNDDQREAEHDPEAFTALLADEGRVEPRDDMTNGFHITHGGLVFALADTAFAIACNEDERITVAQGADITFLKSTTTGQTLTATAVRRARNGRSGLYDVTVTDESGDVVAEVRGRSLTTDRTLPPR